MSNILHIPNILTKEEIIYIREIIKYANWHDGKITAGAQSSQVKNNKQLEETDPKAIEARTIILNALQKNGLFFSASLPKKIFPPMFNCYGDNKNYFGNHIDNAVRTSKAGLWVRTDLSATLFLSDIDEYEGGELIIKDNLQETKIKLASGDMILYPSTSIHRVEKVTAGYRYASFFWIESMIQDTNKRQLLFDLDMTINALKAKAIINNDNDCDSEEIIKLTDCYHNLLRMWVQL